MPKPARPRSMFTSTIYGYRILEKDKLYIGGGWHCWCLKSFYEWEQFGNLTFATCRITLCSSLWHPWKMHMPQKKNLSGLRWSLGLALTSINLSSKNWRRWIIWRVDKDNELWSGNLSFDALGVRSLYVPIWGSVWEGVEKIDGVENRNVFLLAESNRSYCDL